MATSAPLHPRSIWSPHRDSGCIQVCKSLLGLRNEDWQWVTSAREARWIVVDVSRGVDAELSALLAQQRQGERYGIALAKSWSELPSNHWTFFKLPLTPRSFFPWVNQILGLPPQTHVDKELTMLGAEDGAISWDGQLLQLRRWPNLSIYPDPQLRLVEACRRMLSGPVLFDDLRRAVADDATLLRLLFDAQRQDILRTKAAKVPETRPSSTAMPPPSMPSGTVRHAPGLFQRFLNRFR